MLLMSIFVIVMAGASSVSLSVLGVEGLVTLGGWENFDGFV